MNERARRAYVIERGMEMKVPVNPEDIDEEVIHAVRLVAARAFCPPFEDEASAALALEQAKVTSFEDTIEMRGGELGFKATVMIDGRELIVTVEDGGQF